MDQTDVIIDGFKMASNFDTFRLLMWKNFLIQYRHKTRTLLECSVFTITFFPLLILVNMNNLSSNKLESLLSFSIRYSFVLPIANTAQAITIEKERQLKVMMQIMGMQNWLFWSSWFVHSIIMMTAFLTIIVLTSSEIEKNVSANSIKSLLKFLFIFSC